MSMLPETTVPDADRYSDVKLELACKKCGSAGLIPLEHLDRALYCRGCSSFFRVEASGLVELQEPRHERISVQVRGQLSRWQEHKAIVQAAPSARARRRGLVVGLAADNRARWGGVGCLVALLATTMGLAMRSPPPAAPCELPTSLEGRAALFAESLVRRDMQVLTGLTDPSQHRALRIWLAHGVDLPRPVAEAETELAAHVLSTAQTTAAHDAVKVRVKINMSPGGREFVSDQHWVRQGQTWYFRPVRLRSSAEPAGRSPFQRIRGKA